MTQNTLKATRKGQLAKSNRISISLRLELDHHAELKALADADERSMGFIALRRYLKGRDAELSEQRRD